MSSTMSTMRAVAMAAALPVMAVVVGMQPGCATTQTMRSSDALPASAGTVKASEGDNGNTNILIKVKHLAPAARIVPGATVYVVWVQPTNAAKHSVGALTLNDDLEGTLETVTPHRRFMVTVTPETSGQVPQPTNNAVFSAQVDRD